MMICLPYYSTSGEAMGRAEAPSGRSDAPVKYKSVMPNVGVK